LVPHAFRVAYGISPLIGRGIDGKGVTVAVVVETGPASTGDATNIRTDLSVYDRHFGLPPVHLQVVDRFARSLSPSLVPRSEVAYAEMVHAVAPGATVRVVLVPSVPANTLAGAVVARWLPAWKYAISTSDIVSFSGGAGEHCFTPSEASTANSLLSEAVTRHVTVVVSSGDRGPVSGLAGCGVASSTPPYQVPVKEVDFPASDPLVLAVGGTQLEAGPKTGTYIAETAWGGAGTAYLFASGGGFSKIFARPGYQDGVAGTGAYRGVPDVAADAGTGSGLAVLSTSAGVADIVSAAGTEAGAPFWAGVIALADQYAGHDLGFVNPAIYSIAKSSRYGGAFHDVTTGSTTVLLPTRVTGYRAGLGWSPATGWGTPNVSVLVPLLARHASSGATS
jgi:subtilase family serine protease